MNANHNFFLFKINVLHVRAQIAVFARVVLITALNADKGLQQFKVYVKAVMSKIVQCVDQIIQYVEHAMTIIF